MSICDEDSELHEIEHYESKRYNTQKYYIGKKKNRIHRFFIYLFCRVSTSKESRAINSQTTLLSQKLS